MAVSLTGMGLQTAGIVLVHQFRMIDPTQRKLTLIERAPDELSEEVRARVAAMLE
jgi:mRNA-degrading endonuclease toxin of MazEF toxin-antitoxin module